MKKFLALTAACLLAFTMACDSGSSAEKVSDEDAMMMYSAVNLAITEAYLGAMSQAMGGTKVAVDPDPAPKEGTFTNEIIVEGISISGNWTNDGSGYITLNLTITFTGYTDSESESGTVINGSTTYVFAGTETSFTYDVSGDFDVTYEGKDYDFSWDMGIDLSGGVYTYSGSFTIDGYSFTYSGSGTDIK